MKRIGGLYNRICAFDNLHLAYRKARRGKRFRDEILTFSVDLEENLLALQIELKSGNYRSGEFHEFYVYEPKKRLIRALPFRDRVAQHALCNVIAPIFEKGFIYDSYACRVGKGSHAGVDRLTRFLRGFHARGEACYCLKADIQQYFPSVNLVILQKIIRQKIKCDKTLGLVDEIIWSDYTQGNLFATGIPIGNLTSQMFANIYLNELDHFVKDRLGIRWYLRYMDDFLVLDESKKRLHKLMQQVEKYLSERLCLKLNRKTVIFPASHGIDFLGYRVWTTHRLLRKSSAKRMRRKLKKFSERYSNGEIELEKIRQTVASWLGHCKHCNSYRLRKNILDNITFGGKS